MRFLERVLQGLLPAKSPEVVEAGGDPRPVDAAAIIKTADYRGVIKLQLTEKDALRIAARALQGKLEVWPTLPVYECAGEIDWRVGRSKGRSWQLYFYSLRIVSALLRAYEATGDARYLTKAAEVVSQWSAFAGSDRQRLPAAYSDHICANRIIGIIDFLAVTCQIGRLDLVEPVAEQILRAVHQDACWLMPEEHYKANNHGFMASRALVEAGLVFARLPEAERWRETGLRRLRQRTQKDVSSAGVHREHSAFYHFFFMRLVTGVEEFLALHGETVLPDPQLLSRMALHAAHVIKPDGRLPLVGDTSDARPGLIVESPELRFALSRGRKGKPPTRTYSVCRDTGVAVARTGWSPARSTGYVYFQAGFNSTVHKHADDLAVVYYAGGGDVLVGPGAYGYGASRYRRYVKSALSHNVLTLDGTSYRIDPDQRHTVKLTGAAVGAFGHYLRGEHRMYPGVFVWRELVLTPEGVLLLLDGYQAEDMHIVEQRFNLAPGAELLERSPTLVRARLANGQIAEIAQRTHVQSLAVHYDEHDPVGGLIAQWERRMTPVHQPVFRFPRASHGLIMTEIRVQDSRTRTTTWLADADATEAFRLADGSVHSLAEIRATAAASLLGVSHD